MVGRKLIITFVNKKIIMDIQTLEDIKDELYGPVGTTQRNRLERDLYDFRVKVKKRMTKDL